MIKISALTFDIYDDPTGEVARKLPGELHSVKIASHETVEQLHDHQFALVMKTASGVRRRYPLDTADAIKLSQAYFNEVKSNLHPALIKVAEAKFAEPNTNAVAYVDVTLLEPATEKVAFANRVFGLMIDGRECFPLHDATLVKTAATRFSATMIDLNPIERFQYARNISKQAELFNVKLPSDSPIFLYTSNDLNKHALNIAIQQRKEAAGARVSTEVLDQLSLASGCSIKQGEIETDESFKHRLKIASSYKTLTADRIISVLATFDKLAGFNSQHYLRGMLDPFAACFKQAGYETNTMTVDGVDLSRVTPDMLNMKFDTEFVNSFQHNPVQVYQSSPDPIKSVIREMAQAPAPSHQECGVGEGNPSDQLSPMLSNPLKG